MKISKKPGRKGRFVFSRQLLLFFFAILVATGIYSVFLFIHKSPVEAAWFDLGWSYRTVQTVTNSGSAIVSTRKIKFIIDTSTLVTAGKMQSNCNDARFIDASGNLLDFFIDTNTGACNTSTTNFYVQVPQVSAGSQSIYFYYGNPAATKGARNDFFAKDNLGVGLKAYYAMDETTANTCDGGVNDSCDSALSNDGEWKDNAAYTASGKLRGATTYDGTNDYVNIPYNFSAPNQLSISLWFKTTSNNVALFGQASSAPTAVPSGGFVPTLIITNAGKLYGELWTGSVAGVTSVASVDDGNWHHAIITGNVTTQSVYLDGTLVGTRTGTIDQSWWVDSTIGTGYDAANRGGTGTGWKYMTGTIDDVRLYNRAVSSSEVTALYNSGAGDAISTPRTFTPNSSSTATEESGPAPIAFWKFDEGTGTVAHDSTTNANTGTLTNGPVWKNSDECVSGKCLSFDGSDDYVTASSAAYNFTNNFSISVWIKPNFDANANYSIVGSSAYSGSSDWWLHRRRSGLNNQLSFQTFSGAQVSSTATIPANKWTHVAFTLTNGSASLYINGILDGTNASFGSITAGNAGLKIGKRGDNSGFFSGSIDEPKIYNYPRTAQQIQQDYLQGDTRQGSEASFGLNKNGSGLNLTNGLVGWWKMDEASWTNNCSTASVIDSSGNGNNGKACPSSTGPTGGAAGKFGNGGSLDGSNDYVDIPTTSSLTPTTLTVSAWVKPANNNSIILSKYDFGNNNRSWRLFINASNKLDGYISGTGSVVTTVVGTTVLAVDGSTWYHVVMTYDGTSATTYINGKLETKTAYSSGLFASTADVSIGANFSSGSPANYLSGVVDDARIYNRALSPAEVQALYNYAPGPVAYYNLDENTGTTANDTSGNGNTGTLTNIASPATATSGWGQGKFGTGMSLDGTNDYISVADSTSLKPKYITTSAWVKLDTALSSQPYSYPIVLGKYTLGTNTGYNVLFDKGADQLIFRIFNGTTSFAATLTNAGSALGTSWHHITGVFDGSNVKLYVDGILKSTTAAATSISYGAEVMYLGSFDGANNYLRGKIDDVRIYNYPRSQSQIIEDMNAGAPAGAGLKPVAYYKFDEGYGTTANDSSGYGNTGTLTNMASPATSTSGWTSSGKFGKGLVYDGSNDYVSVSNSSALNPTTTLSISAWIYPTTTSSNLHIVSKPAGSTWTSPYARYFLRVASNNSLTFWIGNGSTTDSISSPTGTFSANTWAYVTGVYDGSNLTIYKNGIKIGTKVTTVSITSSNENLAIGTNNTTASGETFQGLIDEVKIYNYALSPDQVALDYNQGKSAVLGSTDTSSSNANVADNSSAQEYCVPGDTSTCTPPVAEYKLDENTGTTANDTSGNGATATLTNGPKWFTGKIGSAVSLDGTDDTLTFTRSAAFQTIATAGSMCMWVYPTILDSTIRSYFDISGTGNNGIIFRIGSNNKFAVQYGTGASTITLSSAATPVLNTWTHLTYVWDSSGLKQYVNGVLDSSNATAPSLTVSSGTSYLGSQGGSQRYFGGGIDQVKAYNYARTPAQIAWDYNKGAPVAWYKMDECQGTIINNSAPTANGDAAGNNGTLTIGATGTNTSAGSCQGTSSEAWKNGVTGKINASMSFDGTDDYVAASSASYNLTDNFSISAWIKPNTDSNTNYSIIGSSAYSTSTDWWLHRRGSGLGNKLTFQTFSGAQVASLTTISANVWTHVVIELSNGTATLYVNGILDTSNASFGTISSGNAGIKIGKRGDNGSYFNGQIDDVRVYNYVLTSSQIKTIYNNGAVSFK